MRILIDKKLFGTVLIMGFLLSSASSPRLYADANEPNEPNLATIVKWGSQGRKISYLAESVHWPAPDFNDVTSYLSEPNSLRMSMFTTVVRKAIDANYLPEDLPAKVRFLKQWRGKDRETFMLQYPSREYRIRVKNQVTTINHWNSHWLVMVIQRKDDSICVAKDDREEIFRFCDQFLGKHLDSSEQNYAGIQNLPGPIFKQIDKGYFLVYAVQARRLGIDLVYVWTDGRTVIINMQLDRDAFSRGKPKR